MGYDRDATPDEIERGEATSWSIRAPEGIEHLSSEEKWRRTNDDGVPYNHKIWVTEPKDSWVTPVELIAHDGYRPEALLRLFGPTAEGPDGIQGWLGVHVEHIKDTVIDAAIDLLESSLIDARIRDIFPPLPGPDNWPTDAEAAKMVAHLDEPGKVSP